MNKFFKKIGPSEIVMLILGATLSLVLIVIPNEGDAERASLYYLIAIPHLICMTLLICWSFSCYFRLQNALMVIKCIESRAVLASLRQEAFSLDRAFDAEMLARKNVERETYDGVVDSTVKRQLTTARSVVSSSKAKFWSVYKTVKDAGHTVHPSYKMYLKYSE